MSETQETHFLTSGGYKAYSAVIGLWVYESGDLWKIVYTHEEDATLIRQPADDSSRLSAAVGSRTVPYGPPAAGFPSPQD